MGEDDNYFRSYKYVDKKVEAIGCEIRNSGERDAVFLS